MCDLCPRHCTLSNRQAGYCGVRRNVDKVLYSENYGKSVAVTEEVIETEAIYHFHPGARILSLGNIGCMMSCKFCQNWQTSQVRHLDSSVVCSYSASDVVGIAKDKGIDIVSWTYNDPVVWHEFVVDTSRLAGQNGIRTLYKSALYIEQDPLFELLDVIDIFSISLKSLDPEFYRRIAHARIEPVLERIREIHASKRHLEISQLVITGLNDNEAEIRKTVEWHLENLDPEVPLHFVGFHPAFQYLDVERTPIEVLLMARDIAREMGIVNVYLGNVNRDEVSDTRCRDCDALLVSRNGLSVQLGQITAQGKCGRCGCESGIVLGQDMNAGTAGLDELSRRQFDNERHFDWPEALASAHLQLEDASSDVVEILVEHESSEQRQSYRLGKNLGRALITKMNENEQYVTIKWNGSHRLDILPVLDRAHFPLGVSSGL